MAFGMGYSGRHHHGATGRMHVLLIAFLAVCCFLLLGNMWSMSNEKQELRTSSAELKSSLNAFVKKTHEAELRYEAALKAKNELQSQLTEAQRLASAREQELGAMQSRLSEVNNALKDLGPLKDQLTEVKQNLERLKLEKDALEKQKEMLVLQNSEKESKIESLKSELAAKVAPPKLPPAAAQSNQDENKSMRLPLHEHPSDQQLVPPKKVPSLPDNYHQGFIDAPPREGQNDTGPEELLASNGSLTARHHDDDTDQIKDQGDGQLNVSADKRDENSESPGQAALQHEGQNDGQIVPPVHRSNNEETESGTTPLLGSYDKNGSSAPVGGRIPGGPDETPGQTQHRSSANGGLAQQREEAESRGNSWAYVQKPGGGQDALVEFAKDVHKGGQFDEGGISIAKKTTMLETSALGGKTGKESAVYNYDQGENEKEGDEAEGGPGNKRGGVEEGAREMGRDFDGAGSLEGAHEDLHDQDMVGNDNNDGEDNGI